VADPKGRQRIASRSILGALRWSPAPLTTVIRDNRSEPSFDPDSTFQTEATHFDIDPNHHLWRNGRVWWIAFTFHTRCGRKYRVRKSLATRELADARVKRDQVLARYAAQPSWSLSLRYERRAAS
jgi:hypothetical protein